MSDLLGKAQALIDARTLKRDTSPDAAHPVDGCGFTEADIAAAPLAELEPPINLAPGILGFASRSARRKRPGRNASPVEKILWVVQQLRAEGVDVEFVEGWGHRGTGGSFDPRAVFEHHTASNKDSGNAPALGIITHGRVDLPPPLSNFDIGRDGTVYVVAALRCNHAGFGGPHKGIPQDSGNMYAWSIEIENNGIGEPYKVKQERAVKLLTALLLKAERRTAYHSIGHKEWTVRKIDPSFDMPAFRDRVRRAMQRRNLGKGRNR